MKRAPGLNCPVYGGIGRTVLRVVGGGRGCHYNYFWSFLRKAEAAISKPPVEGMKMSGGASGLLRKLKRNTKSKTYQRNLCIGL
jgi:hypothetical protein